MTEWPSVRARQVLAALQRTGWHIAPQRGSHRVLVKKGQPNFVFAFHDREEIGSKMLARIARHTGLRPEDLWSGAGDASGKPKCTEPLDVK